eukprot:4811003-Pyramimonas_sp.AAC.1
MRQLSERAAQKIGLEGERVDMSVARSLLFSDALSAGEKRMLEAFLLQSIYTNWRLLQMGHIIPDSSCPLCGAISDDLHHR